LSIGSEREIPPERRLLSFLGVPVPPRESRSIAQQAHAGGASPHRVRGRYSVPKIFPSGKITHIWQSAELPISSSLVSPQTHPIRLTGLNGDLAFHAAIGLTVPGRCRIIIRRSAPSEIDRIYDTFGAIGDKGISVARSSRPPFMPIRKQMTVLLPPLAFSLRQGR
jgi:hypothetical protein